MRKSIYKITNILNNKSYIGQAINPEERFKRHCMNFGSRGGITHKDESIINNAILKYGKENFIFKILESDIENYNEREKYWIKYYNTQKPNGYNITEGGEDPPRLVGENNPHAKHKEKEIQEIKYLLKYSNLTMTEISKKFNYKTCATVSAINKGKSWFDKNEVYPLRNTIQRITEEQVKDIIDDLLKTSLTQQEIAKKYNIGRHIITAINIGENHNQDNLSYPLRK